MTKRFQPLNISSINDKNIKDDIVDIKNKLIEEN